MLLSFENWLCLFNCVTNYIIARVQNIPPPPHIILKKRTLFDLMRTQLKAQPPPLTPLLLLNN